MSQTKKVHYLKYFNQRNINLFAATTLCITENFEKQTGITCLAVSTPDDSKYSEINVCGFAYKNILRPYEELVMVDNSELDITHIMDIREYMPAFDYLSNEEHEQIRHTKNPQLLQIAAHAVRYFGPQVEIEIHFFDDRLDLCKEVEVLNRSLLAPNVTIKSFMHAPESGVFANIDEPVASAKSFTFWEYAEHVVVSMTGFVMSKVSGLVASSINFDNSDHETEAGMFETGSLGTAQNTAISSTAMVSRLFNMAGIEFPAREHLYHELSDDLTVVINIPEPQLEISIQSSLPQSSSIRRPTVCS